MKSNFLNEKFERYDNMINSCKLNIKTVDRTFQIQQLIYVLVLFLGLLVKELSLDLIYLFFLFI